MKVFTPTQEPFIMVQGSVLGPLLFTVYINEINKILKYSSVKLFADDMVLYVSGKNLSEIIQNMNDDLKCVYKWLCANKLKLNLE